MWAVLAHVLNVTVNSLGELPIRSDFIPLLVCQVREGTALGDAISALDFR